MESKSMWGIAWAKNLWRGRQLDMDLDDELRAYVAQLTDEYLARGYRPEDAYRAARVEAGAIDAIKDQVRDARSGASIDTLWQDVRFGVRLLRRSPSFFGAAVVSLALGIGANSAVFGLLNALRLRSLPVSNPQELAEIRLDGPRCCRHTGRNKQLSLPLWNEIRAEQQAFAELIAFADTRFNLSPQGEVRYVEGLFVSGNFFRVLGVPAALGRAIGPEDDRPGCTAGTAVISDALWRREYGGAADILSRTIPTRTGPVSIIGVMPARFFGVEVGRRFDVAMPLCASGFNRADHWWLAVMGRLKPGWTDDQATAHLTAIGPALLRATTPPTYGAEQAKQFAALTFSVHAAPNGVSPLRSRYEGPLWLLLAIAAIVLLTACANVASLFLVRATAREPELALRVALGASRLRIVRQLLVEGLLVAIAGAAAGLVLARLAANGVMALLSTPTDPIVLDVGADRRVLAFHVAIVGLTTAAFALAPSLRATRRAQIAAGGRVTASRERIATRELLVAAQVAMSVVLVSAAMLFLVTFRNLASLDAGFRTAEVLVANVFLNDAKYPPDTRSAVQRELTSRLAAIPGVDGAAHGTTPPLVGSTWDSVVRVHTAQGEIKAEANRNQISADYFRVLQTPFLAGRDFNEHDLPASPKVAIVNEIFARKVMGEPRPLGRKFADGAEEFEVVGIVGNSKQYFLREDFRPIAYTAASQVAQPGLTIRFVLRSRIDMGAAVDSVRRAVAEVDPTAGIRFSTLDSLAADSLQRERLMASLSGFFGFIAIVLAVVGVYGVVSYSAASRRREIGIRLALGARAAHVIRAVLGRLGLVVGAGLIAGLVLALPANAATRSLLYGVDPRDPWVMALIAAVIAGAGVLAAAVPAHRALRTDPVTALRSE
jgi:putative ABC transport system permease protein